MSTLAMPGAGGTAVLVNPEAGSRAAAVSQLEEALAGRGFVREVSTPPALREFARAARLANVDVIALCGGDGTLGRLVTAVCAEFGEGPFPAVAPLGGGTMNTIARSLGLCRGRPETRLRSVVGRVAVKRVRQGTMFVNGRRLGFMLGAGVPARFLEVYERGSRLGALRAVRVLGELLVSAFSGGSAAERLFMPVRGSLSIDGRDLGCERMSILYAAVIDDIGLGFRPTPRARDRLGAFEILAADADAMALVRALPRIWWRGGVGADPWLDVIGEHLIVAFAEPTVYMIDGDVEKAVTELDVRAGPLVEMLVATAA